MSIFTQRTYVQNTILTEKGTVFTAEVGQRTVEQAGNKIKHATIKHAQTIGMMTRNGQKHKTILEVNKSVNQPQWDQNGNIAVMAHSTSYHASLKCSPTEIFYGSIYHNALDLNFGNPIGANS